MHECSEFVLNLTIVQEKFLHFSGEACARVDCSQSVYSTVEGESLLIKLFSPVLFFAPNWHLDKIKEAWTDNLMHSLQWTRYVEEMKSDWQDQVLYSTVFRAYIVSLCPRANYNREHAVAADAALLALPNMAGTSTTSPSQVLCFISLLMSLGGITTGLILLRQVLAQCHISTGTYTTNRDHRTSSWSDVGTLRMRRLTSGTQASRERKLEIQAIVCSLPL
jgi:hypothetical protein